MKYISVLLLISTFMWSCNSSDNNSGNDSLVNITTEKIVPKKDTTHVEFTKDSTKLVGTHLQDTAIFKGDWVIFLRPDSERFEFYSTKVKGGIYETDADFGEAISMSIDSIVGNKNFKGIKAQVSTRRYIMLADCIGGPKVIDRDTVNYGVILTGTGRTLQAEMNVYGGAHYIKAIKKFFGLKK